MSPADHENELTFSDRPACGDRVRVTPVAGGALGAIEPVRRPPTEMVDHAGTENTPPFTTIVLVDGDTENELRSEPVSE
jgi:hypothetical protein